MGRALAVQWRGLDDVQAALSALPTEGVREFEEAMLAIAEGIAADVRRKVPSRSGRMRASYYVKQTPRGAQIKWGGDKAPYAAWIDFGGTTAGWPGRGGRENPNHPEWPFRGRQWRGRRPVKRPILIAQGGRYLYPTIKARQEETIRDLYEALDIVLRVHGLEIT